MRTIKRKLGTKANTRSRSALIAALCRRKTRVSALESTNKAIRFAADADKAKYIERNWLKSIEMWANYAREHSALLL
jgi:hypothetical protein